MASGGHSSSWCAGLSLSRPVLLQSTGSRRAGLVVVAHGPSCSAACGIFPDQGSNPCPLHQQADSQPLRHQGGPTPLVFYVLEVICTLVTMSLSALLLRGRRATKHELLWAAEYEEERALLRALVTRCGNRGVCRPASRSTRVSVGAPPTRVRVQKAGWLRNEIQQPDFEF